MTCIGCRACIKACPASRFFRAGAQMSPREYLYSFLTGRKPSLDRCLQCKSCQSNCPVSIDLPEMILKARAEKMPKFHWPSADILFANVEQIAKLSGSIPSFSGIASRNRPLRWLGEKMLDVSKKRDIPAAQHMTFAKWFRQYEDGDNKNYEIP